MEKVTKNEIYVFSLNLLGSMRGDITPELRQSDARYFWGRKEMLMCQIDPKLTSNGSIEQGTCDGVYICSKGKSQYFGNFGIFGRVFCEDVWVYGGVSARYT